MNIGKEKQKTICEIVKKCGKEIVLPAFGEREHSITKKEGVANFVTDVDVASEEYLIRSLSALFPDASFFAEEKDNGAVSFENRFCFIIDPLDGTTNFMHSMGCSVISVALYFNGNPVFGAVYDPYRDELFHASFGEGSFLNGRPIRVSDRTIDKSLVSFGTSPYNREEYAESTFLRVKNIFLSCADIRRSGSAAMDVCYVACGRTDAYFEDTLSPWDYAAGMLILTEAGGKLTSYNGAVPSPGEKSSVLCSNGVLHQEMLRLLNQ